ncbi:glycoside hydrolase family 31 protein [Plenodomus tracheiphilus IPT5]|uniref:alpha-glucosidase n=1 Tax=Plenodomus tracheiphilus IPT5 TaxID=1408161 RepID=A0A6A7BD53_9PLEO|nr:glycoside hydrolase family 31 protein [Plenodomus tracheiphilus IPT5]
MLFGNILVAAWVGLTHAAPFPAPTNSILPRNSTVDSCPGYAASNVVTTESTLTADLTLAGAACNVYSDDIEDLKLSVEYQTNDRLHVKIYDAALSVYQVQEQVLPRPKNENAASSEAVLKFDIVKSPFSFKVTRKENGEVLFDSSAAPIIFESQYVRLRTSLPTDPNIYGLGEHSDSFRFHTQNYERVLLNSESPNIPQNANLYGTHPVYFDHRGDKGTHGVFLLNATPMNIDIKQTSSGAQYLEYNTIGGIIDLYFLAGKQPAEVSKQYADVVGYSAMYPYWTFGFHQCRFGYWDVNMVAEVVGNYSTAGIPLEVMWTDIDYMHMREDFTTDPERFPIPKMRELIDTLHSRDQRYVLILDPGIHAVGNYAAYQKGHDNDVFLKAADGTDLLGVQWPGEVAWPDWFAPNTQQWWTEEFESFFSPESGINLDGIWVDMNEASNFCADQTCNPRKQAIDENIPPKPTNAPRPNTGRPIPGFPADFQPTSKRARSIRESEGQMKGLPDRQWFSPEYHVNSHRGDIQQFTIWTNTSNHDSSWQYDTHNLYGHMMAMSTHEAMQARRPELRPFVLTRSTFAGTGRKATHWFGDNESSWEHYRTSIRQMLAFVSMHQMPMVGSDVCGFNSNTDEYLCARWALLGAFQPFYRNHAEISTIQQEFYQWPIVTEAAKKAIDTRYRLMDYIYTALYYQTTTGAPMINPLFFKYPTDENTFGIQDQWFYGDSLLISPVTQDYSDTVTYYLPDDLFYDYWTGDRIQGEGKNVTVSGLKYTDIPIHIRGGSIIPLRMNSANTTKALRNEDFSVIIAPDEEGNASGRLYLDDGESIDQASISEVTFEFSMGKLRTKGTFDYKATGSESVTVAKVLVLGQDGGATGSSGGTAGQAEVTGAWKLDGEFEVQI